MKVTFGFTSLTLILICNIAIFIVYTQSFYNNISAEKQIASFIPEIKDAIIEKNVFVETRERAHSQNVLTAIQEINVKAENLESKIESKAISIKILEDIQKNTDTFGKSFEDYSTLEDQKIALQDKLYSITDKLIAQLDTIRNETIARNVFDINSMLITKKLSDIESRILLQRMVESKLNSNAAWRVKDLDVSLMNIIKDGTDIMKVLAKRGQGIAGYKIVSLGKDYRDTLNNYYHYKNIQTQTEAIMNKNISTIVKICENAESTISQDVKKNLDNLRLRLIIFLAFSIMLSVVLAYLLSSHITVRLKKLVGATQKISNGEYDIDIGISSHNDELDNLAISVSNMAMSLESSELQLKDYNRKLEDINKNLEDIVLQRTKDLLEVQQQLIQMNELLCIEKEQLRIISVTDSLTEIYNRGYILKRLQEEANRAIRYEDAFCIILIDIDNFKGVNDNYGHIIGDHVLKEVAQTLKTCLRDTDLLGRYGGEEFLIILPRTNIESAKDAAERIRIEIENMHFTDRRLKITISAGASLYKEESVEELIHKVDELLYEAKRCGKNRIEFKEE